MALLVLSSKRQHRSDARRRGDLRALRDRLGDSIGGFGPDPLLDETLLARGTDVYARLSGARRVGLNPN
jgi:hypothetical protein